MGSFAGHVVHLASGDLWGGAEAVVFELAREQQRQRPGSVSCIVMNPGRLAMKLVESGIPTTTLDESRGGFPYLLRAVRSHVRSFAPRILHAHRQKENLLALLASIRPRGRAPRRITTVHGMPEPVTRGNPLRRCAANLINAATLRFGFDAIVGVSQDIALALRSRYPASRVSFVHNGVPIPMCVGAPGREEPQRRPLRLLALGRLVPIKRFELLRTLSDALAVTMVSRPAITLAGDGPLQSQLRSALAADDPHSRVHMPGFVADTAALLRESDALVVTSDHEGIPMSVLEALASGIAVFGFSVGGLPEIAAPGLPLHLAPAGDVKALAAEIVSYFTKQAPGTRIPPPRDWAFDIRQCAAAYERLYSTLDSDGDEP